MLIYQEKDYNIEFNAIFLASQLNYSTYVS
jgi:hypothetical protein